MEKGRWAGLLCSRSATFIMFISNKYRLISEDMKVSNILAISDYQVMIYLRVAASWIFFTINFNWAFIDVIKT